MEDRKEKIKTYKELIKERMGLRAQIDCIDVDIREIERELCSYGNALEPRCY